MCQYAKTLEHIDEGRGAFTLGWCYEITRVVGWTYFVRDENGRECALYLDEIMPLYLTDKEGECPPEILRS